MKNAPESEDADPTSFSSSQQNEISNEKNKTNTVQYSNNFGNVDNNYENIENEKIIQHKILFRGMLLSVVQIIQIIMTIKKKPKKNEKIMYHKILLQGIQLLEIYEEKKEDEKKIQRNILRTQEMLTIILEKVHLFRSNQTGKIFHCF